MSLTANAPDLAAVDKLAERIQRDVDSGLLPAAQFALASHGEIIESRTFGTAGPDTRFCLFSATKPLVASTVWRLIGEGALDPAQPVTTWFPEFGANGKQDITLEQVMLHQSGFPYAPMGPAVWGERATRRDKMASWRLNWEPGTRYEYHPTAAHWVQAELIETVTGTDFRDAVEELVTKPLGLPRLLGIAEDDQDDIADLVLVGEPATSDELMAAFGVPALAGDRGHRRRGDPLQRACSPRRRQCQAAAASPAPSTWRPSTNSCSTVRTTSGRTTCCTTSRRTCATGCPTRPASRPTARSA